MVSLAAFGQSDFDFPDCVLALPRPPGASWTSGLGFRLRPTHQRVPHNISAQEGSANQEFRFRNSIHYTFKAPFDFKTDPKILTRLPVNPNLRAARTGLGEVIRKAMCTVPVAANQHIGPDPPSSVPVMCWTGSD